MKKRISGLAVLILILLIGLIGCKGSQETTHKTHEFGEWKTTRKASCTEPGVQTRTCECGEKEKKEIPATGHTVEKIEAVEATCTTEGKTEGTKCSVCNTVLEGGEIIPPTHKLETLKAVAVTCTRAGKGEGARCTLCGEIVKRQKKIRATGHNYEGDSCTKCGKHLPDTAVALLVDQFNEEGPANFVTKEAYPGGTTLTFNVRIPKRGPWWGISWTTDPAKAGIYDWNEDGSGVLLQAKAGEWQEVSVTLPKDGKNYYLFFMGEKGQWDGKEILIDDVTITDKDGKVIGTDNFDYGIDAGLFDVEKVNASSGMATAYAYERCPEHVEVVDAKVAATCDVAGKTAGSHCSECGKVLVKQETIPALGHKWNANDICTVCGIEREDLVAVLVIDKLNDKVPMNFMTKEAYPGGSTISFSAYTPKVQKPDGSYTWWGIAWTTDPASASLYDCFASGKGQGFNADKAEWSDYTLTLPNDNQEYYIYFVGAKGEWNGKELEINNFTVTNAAGKALAEESFDDGVENGIFDVIGEDISSGETAVYDRVFELPCSDGHTVVTLPGTAPDCTNPGITEGSYCSVCGATLVAQETIPANGHDYDEITGECACGEKLMDRAVAINIDALKETSPMNFITRAAYAGGSTISFSAYVPVSNWWAISYTKNPADVDLYKWTEGLGAAQPSTVGEWKEYSLTLPDDGETYYFYIVGAKGEWGGKELLIDDVKITNKDGQVIAEDDFNYGMHSGIFNITEMGYFNNVDITAVREEILGEVCMHPESKWHKDNDIEATCTDSGIIGATRCECGEVMIPEEVVPAAGHDFVDGECSVCHEEEPEQVAQLNIDALDANGANNMITKKAYASGSTVTFKVYVPEHASAGWWGINFTADKTTDVYTNFIKFADYGSAKVGEWEEITVTIPDGGPYYLFFGGEMGKWDGQSLLIDDFKVSGDVTEEDNFNAGFTNGLFEVNAGGGTAVSLYEVPEEEEVVSTENYAATLSIETMNDVSNDPTQPTPSFITKEKYAGGSTVSFRYYIPADANTSWWNINFTTNQNSADNYSGTGIGVVKGAWTEFTTTIPEGEAQYVYIAGPCGEWQGTKVLIDDFMITTGNNTVEDNFNTGLEDGLFTMNSCGTSAVSLFKINQMAALSIETMNDVNWDPNTPTPSFITKEKYAGGSTVSFKYFIPEGANASWWNLNFTTDQNSADNYSGTAIGITKGTWTEFTTTIPEGDAQYVYIAGPCGEWKNTQILIDDFKVVTGDTEVVDNFDNGFENGLFLVNSCGTSAVSLSLAEPVNMAAAIAIETINDVNWDPNEPTPSFITKEKYTGGSTVSFRYYIPAGANTSWWKINFTTDQNSADNYGGTGIGLNKGTWTEFTTTIPEGEAQYIYIAGPCGEWQGTKVLIDDFKITTGDTVVEDNFDNGFEGGLFLVNSCGTSAVSLSEVK